MGSTEPGTSVQMRSAPVRHALAPIAAALLAALVCSAAWAQQAGGEPAALVYSPWTRFCGKDKSEPTAPEMCLTIREGRSKTGQLMTGAGLIEPAEPAARILRITVPNAIQQPLSVLVGVDDDPPLMVHRTQCGPDGCLVDFDVDQDFVARLKSGRVLNVRLPGTAVVHAIPLAMFAQPIDAAEAEQERSRAAATEPFSQRILCAGASELCAWKRIPGRR